MKILLAGLMCSILGVTQCWAIDGGPVYGGPQLNITGNYAGVLTPLPTILDPGPPQVTLTDNSLALFTLGIVKVGLATGLSAVFRNGIFYEGTMTGVADPDSARVSGIIAAKFTNSAGDEYDANGQLDRVRVVANPNPNSTATTRMRGTASITYITEAADPNGDSGGPIHYKVRAFKQSEATG